MDIDLAALPDDVETLQQLVRLLAVEHASLGEAKAEIERLNLIIKQLQRSQFGRRAERLDDDQLQLGFEDLHVDLTRTEARLPISSARAETPRAQGQRPSLPAHLPREEMRLDVEHEVCPCCGGALHLISETTSEMLDHVPVRRRVIRICRPRYGCRACGTIHQAPAPERPIARALRLQPSSPTSLFPSIAITCRFIGKAKSSAGRASSWTARRSQTGSVVPAGGWSHCRQSSLSTSSPPGNYLLTTPIPVLDPGRGRTKTGRLWVYARDDRPWNGPDPPAAVYLCSPDRKAERPASHLATFSGTVQVDGYPGFDRPSNGGRIQLAGCWAHARRKFYEVQQATASPIAVEALRRITELYAVKTAIRGHAASVRQSRSMPLVTAMKAWLEMQFAQIPPRGGLADAIRYTLSRWEVLCCFLDDGRIELDNNTVERAIRPVTLGRKNHLFAESDGDAERWATVCSLITTVKLNNVEPFAYLKDVLERMFGGHPISRLDELLPWNWRAPAAIN